MINIETLLMPRMETERLILRGILPKDATDLFEYAQDERVGPFAGWEPHKSVDESFKFINYAIKKRKYGQPGVYSIILKETNKMIGTIEIHTYHGHKGEIGYCLSPKYWGKGYVPEAAKAIIIYGFEVLNLKRLQNGYFLFNEKSKRVAEKLEFKFEGIMRKKYLNFDGAVLDEAILSLTDDDFFGGTISWIKGFKVDYEAK